MADKDKALEGVDTGNEEKLVDDDVSVEESLDKKLEVSQDDEDDVVEEEGEETADLDEEDVEGEDEDDEGEAKDDIVFTNIDNTSKTVGSEKTGIFDKIKRKLGIRPKVHSSAASDIDSSSTITIKYIPPPAPPNMPSARDAARARIYRREKVRYGKEKLEYYLSAMHNDTLVVDDLIMRSEQNKEYVKGI